MARTSRVKLAFWSASLGSVVLSAFAQSPPLPPGLTAVSPPKPVPAFTLPGVNRPTLQSDQLHGKVVVLRFWATH